MAAGAALAVAVAGRGDLVLLGALLALALAERRSSVAALLAVTAVAVRWGSTSLEAITGATCGPAPAIHDPSETASCQSTISVVIARSSAMRFDSSRSL